MFDYLTSALEDTKSVRNNVDPDPISRPVIGLQH